MTTVNCNDNIKSERGSTMVFPSDWFLGMYGVVACIYEWLCDFLSYRSVFVEFHCCHCRWRHFILLLHSLFLIIWPWLFPIWCYTLLILTWLMYDCLILLSYSANYCFVCNSLTLLFSFCLLYFSFSLRYFFGFINPSSFSFDTDWSWVSRCVCCQLPSCLLQLIVEYIFILPSWSCQNLMLDLLTISLFWIAL